MSVRLCFREFQVDLEARLLQWGAEQCVGDVMMKLCSKLRVYSNYLNNYTTALTAIDKVHTKTRRLRVLQMFLC